MNATLTCVVALVLGLGQGTAFGETVRAGDIAAGKSRWVDSHPKKDDALINAKADIGRLRSVDDTFEVSTLWPIGPGVKRDLLAKDPKLAIPDGSQFAYVERVVCKAEGKLSFLAASSIIAPDGRVVRTSKEDAAANRKKVEARSWGIGPYGTDVYSLVCLAAARKCAGKDFSWPPPPNKTPLEHSARADKMRAEFGAQFVPSCKL